jgi:hypothetical protein
MQHQVADRVFISVIALPNLLLGEFPEAQANRSGHLFQFADGVIEKEFRDGGHSHLQ